MHARVRNICDNSYPVDRPLFNDFNQAFILKFVWTFLTVNACFFVTGKFLNNNDFSTKNVRL